MVVEDYMVHKIPDRITFEQGALVEPAAVAVHAVKCSNLQPGISIFLVKTSFHMSQVHNYL